MSSIKQNTPEWLEMRKNHIGASDAPIIMGVSPWKTPYQLWEEKLGLREPPQMNSAMKRGHDLESTALEEYNKITGKDASPLVVFHKDLPYMMASLDGLSSDKSTVVEIKCPGKRDHDIAACGNVPDKYYPQLQHQLATIGLNVVHYFSYYESDCQIVEVERNDEYVKELLSKEAEFWKKVESWEEPGLTDKDYQKREDFEWEQVVSKWITAKNTLKIAKDLEDELRKSLIEMAGGQSSAGAGVQVRKFSRKGSINYGSIPVLKNVDLDQYRKDPTTMWRLSECKTD